MFVQTNDSYGLVLIMNHSKQILWTSFIVSFLSVLELECPWSLYAFVIEQHENTLMSFQRFKEMSKRSENILFYLFKT